MTICSRCKAEYPAQDAYDGPGRGAFLVRVAGIYAVEEDEYEDLCTACRRLIIAALRTIGIRLRRDPYYVTARPEAPTPFQLEVLGKDPTRA